MGLFIESFMPGTADSPSVVELAIPTYTASTQARETVTLTGLLNSDITISLKNKFGALLPDMSALSDIAQVLHSANIAAWIGASSQLWKGTDPINLPLTFYLINYKPGLDYEKGLKALAKLAAMDPVGNEGLADKASVNVHGGYMVDAFANNAEQGGFGGKFIERGFGGKFKSHKIDFLEGAGRWWSGEYATAARYDGTIAVRIGKSIKLSKLILTKCEITPSVIEVCRSNGKDVKPLYYRVSVNLMTCRAALTSDVDEIFGG